MQALIENFVQNYSNNLNSWEHHFLQRIYQRPITEYKKRLLNYDFQNFGKVLDLGCGFGQWSIALSKINNQVFSLDSSKERVDFLKKISTELAINNIVPSECSLPKINFPNLSFDAIFCYGVLFLTPWKKTLHEISRVIRPGGKIYLNANGIGWYKFLWDTQHNKSEDYDPKLRVAETFQNTWNYENDHALKDGMDIIIDPTELTSHLKELGFVNIRIGTEAGLQTGIEKLPPFFLGEYSGDLGVYEVIAQKTLEN